MAKNSVPIDIPARLQFAGTEIYGASCWRGRLADGLGVSRSTLRLWLGGQYKSSRDIDGELVALIDRERDAGVERSLELSQLRKRLLKSSTEHYDGR